ncbi:MAG: Plug domain-containing protein, partial [Verrucomicrobiota bacterium]
MSKSQILKSAAFFALVIPLGSVAQEIGTLAPTTVSSAPPPVYKAPAPVKSYTESKPQRSYVRETPKPAPAPAPAPAPRPAPVSAPVIVDSQPEAMPPVLEEELVVTPSRVVETDHASPFVVESLDQKTLMERSVRTVPEALERVPGVNVQKTSHGQGSPYVRGLTAYHNLFLIDGIRMNNSSFRSGPNQYWATVDAQGLAGIPHRGPS